MGFTMGIYLIIFLFGVVMGSFFNVIGLRLPKKESLIVPRSHCRTCNVSLTALDLVPILSYLAFKGRCRTCYSKISPVYPLMEFATGALVVLAVMKIGLSWELPIALLFISLLIIITVSDLAYKIIMNNVLLLFLISFILLRHTLVPLDPWWDASIAAIIGFLLLFLLAVLSKGGMGGGDIKLYGVIGFVLGISNVFLSLFIASVIGTVVGLTGMMMKKWDRKTIIPFGPFIAIGSISAYFFGEELITFYYESFIRGFLLN
ncbi:prepilin peptidase [Salipaludibacillus sp. LMS25]|uniref:prepilin peptidase n=1 Tax=Salipaludibacillus sp. LMS25 TaxID=2924031 RepID=UPI0020D0F0FA|nr:A24 family peptidase [Salipaludibacillus sp. LMS25]UTR15471.1 prepilin peptidase [Salipaludibacillus sp. LMS25]